MKNTIKKMVGLIVVMIMLCSCGENYYNEWIENNGNKYYYNEQGQMLKDCYASIYGSIFAFDRTGKLIIDEIVNIDGKYGIVNKTGALIESGWYKYRNEWYYLKNSEIQTGWIQDGGNWYYLDTNYGKMLKDKWIDNDYYCNSDGIMLKNGWHNVGNEKLYFDINGKVDRNKLNISFKNIPCSMYLFDVDYFGTNKCYCYINSVYFEGKKAWIKGKIENTRGDDHPALDVTIYYNVYDGKGRQIINRDKIYIKFTQRNGKAFEIPFDFPFYKIDKNDNYVMEIQSVQKGLY